MLQGTIELPAGPTSSGDESSTKPRSVDLVTALYAHPLIKNLAKQPSKLALATRNLSWLKKRAMPSYIPSKTFALALLDVLRGPDAVAQSATNVLVGAEQCIDRIQDKDLKRVLSLFVEKATTKVDDLEKQAERIRDNVEDWFNDRMARASGWYKRKAQLISCVLAAIVVLMFNADSIHVADRLWKDGALRDSVVATAAAFKEEQPEQPADAKKQLATLSKQAEAVRKAGFPIGWRLLDGSLCARLDETDLAAASADTKCWNASPSDYSLLIAGWILTALAVSLGSNFWFDMLGKVLQLRGSGPKVDVSTGEVESKKS
jgi:hypothetical protein